MTEFGQYMGNQSNSLPAALNFGYLGKQSDKILRHLRSVPSGLLSRMYARWCQENNFGDALSPWLLKKITGVMPFNIELSKFIEYSQTISRKPDFVVIGSILQWCGKHSVIWGTGFISQDSLLTNKPWRVLAVRGALTRSKLLEQGVDCPKIYGDPALLIPRFWKPVIEKKYDLGLIPHYVDKAHEFVQKARKISSVLVIDVQQEPEKVICDILSCEKIASSSLHGIVVADAYNIPSLWVKLSNKIVGHDFKFRDYFSSVGDNKREAYFVTEATTIKNIMAMVNVRELRINLNQLWAACPFKSQKC